MDDATKTGIPEGLVICQSPFCDVRFKQTGIKIKPRMYCCDQCKLDLWAVRRTAKLLEGLSNEETLKIVRGER